MPVARDGAKRDSYTSSMRIIAGQWRGRQISAPPGDQTRPILDRAKTVLFDVLGHRFGEPGLLPPFAVLDLYSGSGALGFESLSRGARYCLFVEQHRPTAALIRRNMDTLGVIGEARVVDADASKLDFPLPPRAEGLPQVYELVFMDPPYRLLEGAVPDRTIKNLLQRLATHPAIAESALIVVRHGLERSGGPDLSPLVERERRDVGTMTFRFMARPSAADITEQV